MEMRLVSANRLSRFALEHPAALESAFWSELANDLLRLAGPDSPLKYAVLAVWVNVDKTPCNQVWDAPSFEDAVIEFCEIQAKTSHFTAEGISCAKRIALAVHFYKYKLGDKSTLIDFVNDTLKEKEVYKVTSPIDMHGYFTTQAVIKIVSEADSMQDCLKTGIDYGGDTDTVAALCMAILSHKENCDKTLPLFLYEGLENDKFGKDFLIQLDTALDNKFN